MRTESQYLRCYAQPEAHQVTCLTPLLTEYDNVLTVPAHAEPAEALELLSDIRGKRALAIWVVNDPQGASVAARTQTQALLSFIQKKFKPQNFPEHGFLFASQPDLDILCVERTDNTTPLNPKQGVGAARKIAADIAVALAARGYIRSRMIHCCDADTRLPQNYFTQTATSPDKRRAAAVYSFRHTLPPGPIGQAVFHYERYLRRHITGLAQAGSPYAFHSLGSTLAIDIEAYQAVRGFPLRAAAEDFYLLNKLAKVGVIDRLAGAPVVLQGRISSRVPIGTGPAVQRILAGRPPVESPPASYLQLGIVLEHLRIAANLGTVPMVLQQQLTPDILRHLERALQASQHPNHRLRHLHTWFDGLKTRQYLRHLQARTPCGCTAVTIRTLDEHQLRNLQETLLVQEQRIAAGPAGVPWHVPHTE